MKKSVVSIVFAASVAGGCTSVTPEITTVQIVGSAQAMASCKRLQEIRGDQNLIGGVMFQGAAYNDAINQMKKKTAAIGGNRLLVINATAGLGGANAIGEAYKC